MTAYMMQPNPAAKALAKALPEPALVAFREAMGVAERNAHEHLIHRVSERLGQLMEWDEVDCDAARFTKESLHLVLALLEEL